jgi:hypothetical protein
MASSRPTAPSAGTQIPRARNRVLTEAPGANNAASRQVDKPGPQPRVVPGRHHAAQAKGRTVKKPTLPVLRDTELSETEDEDSDDSNVSSERMIRTPAKNIQYACASSTKLAIVPSGLKR